MADSDEVHWCDLLPELCPVIAKHFNTSIDVLRFCSVCKSWRSSLSPASYKHSRPVFPLKIRRRSDRQRVGDDSHLTLNTVYLLQPIEVDDEDNHNKEDLGSCTGRGSGAAWLIKVEELELGKLRLLHPVNCRNLKYPPDTFPKVLNLMDTRVIELVKACSVRHVKRSGNSGVDEVKRYKVVTFPSSSWTGAVEETPKFAICKGGKLVFLKLGDKKWTRLDAGNFYYDDIILHKGKIYVVDKLGTVSWIDPSSLKLIQFSPPLCGPGDKKYIVESCGCLYVVDMFLDGQPANVRGRRQGFSQVVAIKVYKLDEEWGTWVDVKNLGDRMFVLSQDCSFSVSATRLAGYESNCIYFHDNLEPPLVFNMENSRFGTLAYFPTCSKVFWPATSFSADTLKWVESQHFIKDIDEWP